MQDKKPPSDPFQVVWPVGPSEEPAEPKRERSEPVRETPVLLPVDVLLRRGARMLDPANATQPGRARRGTDNKRLQNPSETAVIRYTPTAYVSDEILVQAGGRNADRISAVTRELQTALDEADRGPVTPNRARARRRSATGVDQRPVGDRVSGGGSAGRALRIGDLRGPAGCLGGAAGAAGPPARLWATRSDSTT